MKTYKKYLSVAEVALMFGVKKLTVRQWIKNGEINATKIGQKWFFRQEDIDQLFVDNSVEEDKNEV